VEGLSGGFYRGCDDKMAEESGEMAENDE